MKKLQLLGFLRRSLRGTAAGLAALCVWLLPVCVSGQPDEAAAPAADASTQASSATSESDARGDAIATVVNPLMDEASKLSSEGKFTEAKEKLLKAQKELEVLGFGPYISSKQETVKARLNKNNIAWANKLMDDAREEYRIALLETEKSAADAKLNSAIQIANEAAKINPAMNDAVKTFAKDCEKMISAYDFRKKTDINYKDVDPRSKERQDEIHTLLKQSEILYNNQLYSKVRDNMELILLKDPYNEEAIRMLNKVYRKLYKAATARRENDVLERMDEVEWKWNNAVLPTENIVPKDDGPKELGNEKSNLYDKLQRIVFDSIEFNNATISSVINYLNVRSKNLDPEGTGINLILQLNDAERSSVPAVTMSFDHVPMGEAIRYLCQGTDLKYRVEDKAVIIGKTSINEMDTRFFRARAALVSSITGGASDNQEGAGGETDAGGGLDAGAGFVDGKTSDLFTSGAGAKVASTAGAKLTSEALKKYFSDRGIPFDEGSSISYDGRAGKLIVTNTPENLRKFESLLRDIDVQTPLVLIEAKVLEITQTDLEELGFDWMLNHDNTNNPRWQLANTDKILRNYAGLAAMNSTSTTPYTLINSMNVMPNFGGDNSYNLYLTVNALDQSNRGEILSTPKIMATSGTTAIIRMVQEYYFPESWTEPEISVSNGILTYTPSYPEFGDATDVGIRFEVTPTVSPNNYTISLHLNPQVIAFTGWTDYSYDVLVGTIEGTATIKMPELSRRDVDTNIKVYDGETVILGGMLRDESNQRDDRWPGLGEVPIIGRLFASEMSRSVKRNLLIFVTSRLMSYDGVPVRSNPVNGVFDFSR